MPIKVVRTKGQSMSERRSKARPKGYRKTQKARDLWKKTGVKGMPGRPGKAKKKRASTRKKG